MDVLFAEWEQTVWLVVGVIGLLIGIPFRAGYLRRWIAVYRNPLFPPHMRNSVFAAIPISVVCLLWWLGLTLYDLTGSAVLAVYVLLASLPVLGVSLYVSFRAPAWSKPRWVRDGEPLGWSAWGGSAGPVAVSAAGYAALAAVLVAAVVIWWLLELSAVALIMGLGFIVPVLLAARPKKAGSGGSSRWNAGSRRRRRVAQEPGVRRTEQKF